VLASAVITVYSISKIINIIKAVGNTYDVNKLIVHSILVVVQTSSVIVYVTIPSNAIVFIESVILMNFVCQIFVAYICLTMGSHKALNNFELTIEPTTTGYISKVERVSGSLSEKLLSVEDSGH
jgi:uncharacterized membrane protein